MPENNNSEVTQDRELCKEAIMSNDYYDFILEESNVLESIIAKNSYVCAQKLWTKYINATMSRMVSRELLIANFGYNTIPKCYGLLDVSSLESTGILKIRRQPYLDLFGREVMIGFIDTGIDYTDSLFINDDGTTRIETIWDQTILDGIPPKGFSYGAEYTKEQINEALKSSDPYAVVPSKDENGHGTMMAGVAAGGIDVSNDFSGVAPMSSLLVVKLKEAKPYLREFYGIREEANCYQENDILVGIQYLVNVAKEARRPLVICLGVGTNSGDHNGSSVLSDFINVLGDYTGLSIITGVGNEANRGHHFRGEIEDKDDFTKIEIRVGEQERAFSMEIWGSVPNSFSISIISPTGEVIPRIPARLDFSQSFSFVLERTRIFMDYRIIEARAGDELAFIRFSDPTPGIWTIEVYSDNNPQTIDAWLPMSNLITEDTYFLEPDPFITITEPGNAKSPITVATYNHVDDSIFINSGRGNTRNNLAKPDITAPGVDVYVPTGGGNYTRKTGSSIAVAHVAGATALAFEWAIVQGKRTSKNYISVKQFLIRGAHREDDMQYPNPIWGYGTLDLYQSFESLRQ